MREYSAEGEDVEILGEFKALLC